MIRIATCFLAMVIIASAAIGHEGSAAPGHGPPGVWYQGRFIGFVPAHAQATPQGQPPSRATTESRRPTAASGSATVRTPPAARPAAKGVSRVSQPEPARRGATAVADHARVGRPRPAVGQSAVEATSEDGSSLARYVYPTGENAGSGPIADRQVVAGGRRPPAETWFEPGIDVGADCCSRPGPCCNRFWVRGEYLLWWSDSMGLPPLVTTGAAGAAANVAGVLGQAGTQVLFGGGELESSTQSGARLSFGWWFDPAECQGVEANYFGLGRQTSGFSASNLDFPILARPVFDTRTGAEASMLVAHPDFLTGSIDVEASTELQGAEVLLRSRLFEACDCRLDVLMGYRFTRLDEGLRISQSSRWTATQGTIVVGTTQQVFDLFDTENQFHGGEIGLAYRQDFDCWSLDVLTKLALGNNHSVVRIDGQTINTVPSGGTAAFVGGLLAQQTNIGTFERNTFGLVPELAVTLRRELACNLRFSVGYNLLYWSRTVRPGDSIDRQVSQFPPEVPTGTLQPSLRFETAGFLVQGLQLGLEYQY